MKKLIPILFIILLFIGCDRTANVSAYGAGADSQMFGASIQTNLDYGFGYTENAVVTPNDSVSGRILIEWPTSRIFIYSSNAVYFNCCNTIYPFQLNFFKS